MAFGALLAATRIVDIQSALRSVDELIPASRRDLLAVIRRSS